MARLLLLGALVGASGCLLAAASGHFPELLNSKCGQPELIENAQIVEGSSRTKLRYSCIRNFKRKAGTSNLILCKQDETTKEFQWTKAQLSCIRDPSLPVPPPKTTTEDSRRETETSTPSAPKTTSANPSAVSLCPHGSKTASQPASDPANAPLRTATPSPRSSSATAATEFGHCCPAVATEGVTLPQRATPRAPQPRTTTIPITGNRATAVSSSRIPVNTTQASDTSVLQRITGSPYFRIGFPFLAVTVIIICLVLWSLYRRWSRSLRQTGVLNGTDFHQMALTSTMSGGGGQVSPSGNDPDNSGAGHEGVPMLWPHGATSFSTG